MLTHLRGRKTSGTDAVEKCPSGSGTPDAIHLSTAELWREITGKEPFMATHDQALALAARASGFRVLGG